MGDCGGAGILKSCADNATARNDPAGQAPRLQYNCEIAAALVCGPDSWDVFDELRNWLDLQSSDGMVWTTQNAFVFLVWRKVLEQLAWKTDQDRGDLLSIIVEQWFRYEYSCDRSLPDPCRRMSRRTAPPVLVLMLRRLHTPSACEAARECRHALIFRGSRNHGLVCWHGFCFIPQFSRRRIGAC